MTLTPLPRCLACGGAALRPFLDLGMQPLANAFHDGGCTHPRYPLVVQHCVDCAHCQLTHAVAPETLYSTYLYVSGTSATLRADMATMAQQLVADFRAEHGRAPRVLDIACNDGTLLEAFRAEGCEVMGVEPAYNLVETCRRKGLVVAHTYWPLPALTEAFAHEFDVVTALNVLGHTRNPLAFLEAAADALSSVGCIITQTSQEYWLEDDQFDYWYHEHLSGFTRRSLSRLALRAGLEVQSMLSPPIHGGSLRATLVPDRYRRAAQAAERTKATLAQALEGLDRDGYTVAGYGAAAKGMTLLNYTRAPLAFIVDDAPAKHDLLTPGLNIPIVPPSALATPERLALLLLAWNFADEITAKVKAIRGDRETVFIVPFPEVKVWN